MCIKIICSDHEHEFNPSMSLSAQVVGAHEIKVSYEPNESDKIDNFVGQIECMVRNGASCNVDIKVKTNNHLDGIRLERKLDTLKRKLEVNEVVKELTKYHINTDYKLEEMRNMCMEKSNE